MGREQTGVESVGIGNREPLDLSLNWRVWVGARAALRSAVKPNCATTNSHMDEHVNEICFHSIALISLFT